MKNFFDSSVKICSKKEKVCYNDTVGCYAHGLLKERYTEEINDVYPIPFPF